MKSRLMIRISVLVVGALLWAGPSMANEIGLVMDASGDAKVAEGSSSKPAEIGSGFGFGSVFVLGSGAKMSLVTYIDCNEWSLSGPGSFKVSQSQTIVSEACEMKPSRNLPVCYEPELMEVDKHNTMGAFVMRGAQNDPVAALRNEYQNGNASNSTLMTLIMHDLNSGKKEQAKPYYQELKSRAPNSPFIKSVARWLE